MAIIQYRFELFADYHLFYLQDEHSPGDLSTRGEVGPHARYCTGSGGNEGNEGNKGNKGREGREGREGDV